VRTGGRCGSGAESCISAFNIGRTVSTVSIAASCDAFAEKAIRGMASLETHIDELSRMAAAGEVSQQAQDFCLRLVNRLKGEMTSLEEDLLDLCGVMEEEFEVQCQHTVSAEVAAYEQCLIAVHVEVCRLFEKANSDIDASLNTTTKLRDTLDSLQNELFLNKMKAENFASENRVLQAELKALRLETETNKTAATFKNELMQSLEEHKKALSESQANQDTTMQKQVEELQRQLHEALAARDDARALADSLKDELHKEGGKMIENDGEGSDVGAEHLAVLRELQTTLRVSEAERNRLQTELVTKYEESTHMHSTLQRSLETISTLELEISRLQALVKAHQEEALASKSPSGGSTPPLSCHSQNPVSPSIRPEATCSKSRFLDDHFTFQSSDTSAQNRHTQLLCDKLQVCYR
jgi:myosin heavy subunit